MSLCCECNAGKVIASYRCRKPFSLLKLNESGISPLCGSVQDVLQFLSLEWVITSLKEFFADQEVSMTVILSWCHSNECFFLKKTCWISQMTMSVWILLLTVGVSVLGLSWSQRTEPMFASVTQSVFPSDYENNPTQLNYGVAVTDVDGDGDLEMFVSGWVYYSLDHMHCFQQDNEDVKQLRHYVSPEKILYQRLEVIWCCCAVWVNLTFLRCWHRTDRLAKNITSVCGLKVIFSRRNTNVKTINWDYL